MSREVCRPVGLTDHREIRTGVAESCSSHVEAGLLAMPQLADSQEIDRDLLPVLPPKRSGLKHFFEGISGRSFLGRRQLFGSVFVEQQDLRLAIASMS